MKLFNKFVSIVTVVAFVLSMMAVPAFAAGMDDFPEAAGTEKLVVTYYSDAACESAITKAEPGATVYAKVSANLPKGTLGALDVTLKATGATIEGATDNFDAISNMARPPVAGTTLNTVATDKTNANIFITLGDGQSHDSPANGDYYGLGGLYLYTNIGITSFDIATYELKVTAEAGEEVSFSNIGGVGLNIGAVDMDAFMEGQILEITTPFTVEGTLAIESAAAADVISYSAALKADKVDPESATLEADVKALVEVTRTLNSVGSVYAIDAANIAVDTAAKTVTVTFPNDKTTGEATQTLSYAANLMTIAYGTPVVTLDSEFDFAKTDAEIAAEVVVTVVKTKDNVPTVLTLAAGTDYDVDVIFATDANEGSAVVTFIGDWDANDEVEKTFTRTNAPVSYKNLVASISDSSFAFGTTADQIKTAIAVKGTKVEGVVETANAEVPAEAYEITVDLAAGTATVTMNDSTPVDNTALTFEISEETFTYSNYTAEYTGENEYDYTVDADAIVALVKVTATKTGETTPAETVDLTNEVDVVVDKDAGTITVTWKAESAHAGNDIDGAVISVTFNDVITYQNGSAIMNKTSFVEGTEADNIIAEVVVSLEKLVNGTKDDTFVPAKDVDYTLSYADNKVTVDFTADGIDDVEIPVTFYPATAVTAKVTLDTTTVVDGKVTLGEDFVAYIELDGLTSAWGGEFTLSVNKGTIKAVEAATGYTINNVPTLNAASTTVEYTKAIGDDGITAGARVLKVTVSTVGTAKDDVVTLKVDSMKVSQVEDFDINELPTQTSEAKADVTIDQFVRAMSVELPKLEIGIVTLGTLNDDKYVEGVSIDGIDLTGKVSVDAAGRKLVIKDVVLDGSATENEVTYTLKVVVPGYTTIEADIVIEYVFDEDAADYNTWKIKSNGITADSKIYAGDVAGDDNTITAADYSDIIAVYGDAIADKYDLYEGGATVDQKDIITMVWAFEQYGMTQVTAAGIIE